MCSTTDMAFYVISPCMWAVLWVWRMKYWKKLGVWYFWFISYSIFHSVDMNIAHLFIITGSLVEVFKRTVSIFLLQCRRRSQFIPSHFSGKLFALFCLHAAACYQSVVYTAIYSSTPKELKMVWGVFFFSFLRFCAVRFLGSCEELMLLYCKVLSGKITLFLSPVSLVLGVCKCWYWVLVQSDGEQGITMSWNRVTQSLVDLFCNY